MDNSRLPSESPGAFAELDARWQGFEATFDDFEDWDAAWFESDERRREMASLEELLKLGPDHSPFNKEGFVEGLKLSIGFFSKRQLQQLERLTEHLGEGEAEAEDLEHFEKGSEKEGVASFGERQAMLDSLDQLMLKYYELVTRLALQGRDKEEVEAIIKVAWTAIEACAHAIREAVDHGKTFTEVQLIIFRFEKQLDALDPDHGFVPRDF